MRKLSGMRRGTAVTAGMAVAVTAALVSFGIGNAVGSVSAPPGTTLCVQSGVGLVLTPTASGRCVAGQTPIAVANLSGVAALQNSVGSLQNGVGSLQNGVGALQNGVGSLTNSVGSLSNAVAGLQSVAVSRFVGSISPAGNGSTSTYTVPTAVTELRVELWGGGGGGAGGATEGGAAGAGGAQGDYTHSVINVVPGDTCTVVVGSGGTGGSPSAGLGATGADGSTSSFSCTQSPGSLTAPGGRGAVALAGGIDGPPGFAPSAAYQTIVGAPGDPSFDSPLNGTPGGGVGFPGAGGNGGDSPASGPATAGHTGAPGLALITPVG